MAWVFGVVAVGLTVFLLWTLISPRGQWRALVGWSVRDIHRDEPSGTGYALRRLGAAISLLGILTVAGFAAAPFIRDQTAAAPTHVASPIELMWGPVQPVVINRIIVPSGAPSGAFPEMPVLGYQSFADGTPNYVSRLQDFRLLGRDTPPGMVGDLPPIGNGAMDFADIVLNVRAPLLCVPREIVLVESADDVRVGVFYGLPSNPDGTENDSVAGCPTTASVTTSVLIPLQLGAPLDGRPVLTLGGEPIDEVGLID
ncbi:hypothetical protein M2152_000523 [Microbacteriaceae bacterium SG_E_30_P1]|uniref:DUF6199 domain-containing protein n=1 Tax=Antiquaquibacter oligotrophicus TaxID=2880260 RepID=A0ABT6KKR8_9MICO|nr:hypothetical protein [Antiquaquibacter oligotrophicus]MDH6180341.1 hypothetical protein [Antiquaquibacter oligotrophicus]UDF13916.1 hypothetical protein LH407_03400 [Antiquaquibacter oligotrophicus]